MSPTRLFKSLRHTKEKQLIQYLESINHILVKTQRDGLTLEEVIRTIDEIIQETKESIQCQT